MWWPLKAKTYHDANKGSLRVDYSALDKEVEDNDPEGFSQQKNNRLQSFVQPVLCLVLILGVFFAIFLLWPRTTNKDGYSYTYTDCGSSPDEARQRGCIYEPMQRAWIPPECYFPEPSADYDTFRDRVWYEDSALTIEMDAQGLESGDVEVAYTRYWHDEHCAYVLRKLALAVTMGKHMINALPLRSEHFNHCALSIAERIVDSYNTSFVEMDESRTVSHLGYEKCVPLKVSRFS